MEDFPKTNELIPELLQKSKDIIKNINNRIKVNEMIDEFNTDANKDLKRLISLSTRRYKGTKTGNKVSSIIKSQEPEVQEFIEKIKKDDIYINTKEINEEKEKLNKNINKQKKENMADLREKIKISSKYQSLREIENQKKKLEKKKNNKKKKKHRNKNKNKKKNNIQEEMNKEIKNEEKKEEPKEEEKNIEKDLKIENIKERSRRMFSRRFK